MKYSIISSFLVFGFTNAYQDLPTFAQLGNELQSALTPAALDIIQQLVPFANKSQIANFLNGSSFIDMTVTDAIDVLAGITNGLNAFQTAVNGAGGQDTFQNLGNMIIGATSNGLIGHFNQENVVSAEMLNVTYQLQSINNLTVQLLYQDLYTLIITDIEQVDFTDIGNIVTPTVNIINDITGIIQAVENMFSRRQLRSADIEEINKARVLQGSSALSDIEAFFCEIEPLISASISGIQAIVTPQLESDLNSLSNVLSKIADVVGGSVSTIASTVQSISQDFSEYGPVLQNDVLPIAEAINGQLQQMCGQGRRLTTLNFQPFTWLMKLFDMLENGVENLIDFLGKFAIQIGSDILHGIEEAAKLLFPKIAADLSTIINDIENIVSEAPQLIASLKQLPPALDTTKSDLMTTIADSKALLANVVTLVKIIA